MRLGRPASGFSLTELLVVIAIIVILLAVLIVSVNAVYERSLLLKCQHNLEQIGQACIMYSGKYHGLFPASWDFYSSRPWYEILRQGGYVTDPKVVVCPLADIPSTAAASAAPVVMPTDAQEAVLKALRWLKSQQNPDGSWPAGTGEYMTGRLDGISGLAMMCFLFYGCTTEQPAEFSDTVTKGLQFLLGIQGTRNSYWAPTYPSRGWFGNPDMYETGIGTAVMADAYRLMGDVPYTINGKQKSYGAAARAGVEFLTGVQNATTGAWGYGGGGPDTSVTGWAYQAIAASRRAGLSIPSASTAKTELWFVKSICVNRFACVSGLYVCDKCGWIGTVANYDVPCPGCSIVQSSGWFRVCTWSTDGASAPGDGKCAHCHGTAQIVPDDYRLPYWMNTYGGPHPLRSQLADSRRLTSISFAARAMAGQTPEGSAATGSPQRNMYEQLQWLKNQAAYLNTGIACTDLYFIYYMSLGLSALGGDKWLEWKDAVSGALIDEQNPNGTWSHSIACFAAPDCLTYPTALACVSLEGAFAQYLRGTTSFAYGSHSYGYNPRFGMDRRSAGRDTILVIDYQLLEIDRKDPTAYLAPRHGGRCNALMADGSVKSFRPEEIPVGAWTPSVGD